MIARFDKTRSKPESMASPVEAAGFAFNAGPFEAGVGRRGHPVRAGATSGPARTRQASVFPVTKSATLVSTELTSKPLGLHAEPARPLPAASEFKCEPNQPSESAKRTRQPWISLF